MAQRRKGFYWVQDHDLNWHVAELDEEDYWFVPGRGREVDESYFNKIGERLQEPNE